MVTRYRRAGRSAPTMTAASRSGLRRAVDRGNAPQTTLLRDIDVSGTEGYGIWAPDGTGPAVSWAQALLAISQETVRVPGEAGAILTPGRGALVLRVASGWLGSAGG